MSKVQGSPLTGADVDFALCKSYRWSPVSAQRHSKGLVRASLLVTCGVRSYFRPAFNDTLQ